MSNYDIVKEAQHCAQQLQEAGIPEWSRRILDAIEAGATGGEIVMALRWNLQELEKSSVALPAQIKQSVRQIIQEINKTGW